MGARLKLIRAREHLDVLSNELAAFTAGEPYRVIHEPNADLSEHIFYAKVLKEPPQFWSVIVGDALQNMRSALDHLVWGLWPAEFRAEFERSIYFPIYRDETAFFQTSAKSPSGYSFRSGMHKIHKIGTKARTAIQELQPYKRRNPDEDWLWILNELARVDRHQGLSLIGAFADTIGQSWRKRGARAWKFDVSIIERTWVQTGPFEDGAKIGHFNFTEPDMDVYFKASPFVAFRDAGPASDRNVLGTLTSIRRHIERVVIPKLERFF